MLSIIHKKHKDRYRIQFCNERFYSSHQFLFEMWKSKFKSLSNVEKLHAWVVVLCCLRRPYDWFAGKRLNTFKNLNLDHPFQIQEIFRDTPIQIPKKISAEINISNFINEYRIKAVPESCMKSLILMLDQTYPLIITEGVTSPNELLQIQISGKRIVALNENYQEWPHTLYSERDHLGFILHDLVHADHFFKNFDHRNGQLGFYHLVNKLIQTETIQNLLTIESFKTGFEYIISDMNSHPVHLFQTLHSLLFNTLKNDLDSNSIWTKWLSLLNLNEIEFEALLAINTNQFNTTKAKSIEKLCLEKAIIIK